MSTEGEGEWGLDNDQSRAPTVEEASLLQPRSNSGMDDILQEHAAWRKTDADFESAEFTKPEAVTSSMDNRNSGTISPGSRSSGSDDADADAVERQLLDPLSLQVGIAEEYTQATPIVSIHVYRAPLQYHLNHDI